MAILKDLSISAIVAGFVTVLVGFTSSAVIIFQAAQALDASPAETASWMWALGLGMGITCIGLSLRYRIPVVTAWSTPGAAMLIPTAAAVSMEEAIGAFLVSALLITVCGFTGWFERVINRIPTSIASAMLAGVLLRFGLDIFVAMQTQFILDVCHVFDVSNGASPCAALCRCPGTRARNSDCRSTRIIAAQWCAVAVGTARIHDAAVFHWGNHWGGVALICGHDGVAKCAWGGDNARFGVYRADLSANWLDRGGHLAPSTLWRVRFEFGGDYGGNLYGARGA